MSKDIKLMIEELEEYYECAGFEDYYNKVLKNMSDEEIISHYNLTFSKED